MLKIRMQGTKKDLHQFRRLLERHEGVDVKEVSEPFANKGTNKYFRMYAEVEKTEKQISELEESIYVQSDRSGKPERRSGL